MKTCDVCSPSDIVMRSAVSTSRPLLFAVALGTVLLIGALPNVVFAQTCAPLVSRVDTSYALTITVSGILGYANGQTFSALDTVIRRISVWRAGQHVPNYTPMKLWITAIDSIGVPDATRIIREGPTIVVPGGVLTPTEIPFSLDPPCVLPARGTFAFFVQHLCTGYYELLVADGAAYRDGIHWQSGRSLTGGCPLRENPYGFTTHDMVFEIEFCESVATPVQRLRWGDLKVLYR